MTLNTRWFGALSMAAAVIGAVMTAAPAHAGEPCTPAWTTVSGEPATTDNIVCCSAIAPNGDVYFGGTFTQVEGVAANYIATWDGTTFSPLGDGLPVGLNYALNAIAILPNGDVLAPHGPTGIGSWNGSEWSLFGGPIAGSVLALAVLPNGDIVAGGSITSVGGTPVNGIARWDGSSWHALGSGATGGSQPVRTLKVLSNGDLLVGGTLTSADGVSGTRSIARWNAIDGWSALGAGLGYGTAADSVNCLAELSNGDIVAGGNFNSGINIARWDDNAWSPLGGAGLVGTVWTVTALPNDRLAVGGQFQSNGGAVYGDVFANRIILWDGSAWSPFQEVEAGQEYTSTTGVSGSGARCLVLVPDEYDGFLVGGSFTTVSGTQLAYPYIARYGCPIPPPPACAADFNDVNGVTVQDIFDFLTAWLAGSATADFNHVNGVTVQDIFDFLTAWLAGC